MFKSRELSGDDVVSAVCEWICLFFLLFVFVICDNSVDRVLHGLLLFHGELSAKRVVQNALVLVQISKKNIHCTL